MSKNKPSEIRVIAPRRVPLMAAQEREAVALLAELLLDEAAKRRGLHSAGALDSASGGAIDGVVSFPGKRREAREAA
jgi:hypothetical protein